METAQEVDELGDRLLASGMSHSAVEDYLEHYGKKGMKWGVRKGKSTTGVTRTRGAQIDRNDRQKANIKKAMSGEKYKARVKLGQAFMGKEAMSRRLNDQVKELNAQNKRLKSGKITVEDRLVLYANTNVASMLISRRPQ